MLLVALGCVAGAIGALCVMFVVLLPSIRGNPEVATRLDELQREIPIDPVVAFGIMAAIYLLYAGASIPLGILARRGRTHWVIAALVLAIVVGVFLLLSTLASLVTGNLVGGLLPALLATLHGMAAMWLIAALRDPAPAPAAPPAAQRGAASAALPNPCRPTVIPASQATALPYLPQQANDPPQPMQGYYEPLPRKPQ